MIITCPNCNKKFEIDASLIPSEGRKLQCGSCNNVWIYKFEEKNNDILNLIDEIDNEDIPKKSKLKEDNKQPTQKIKNENLDEIKKFIETSENMFGSTKLVLEKKWKDFIELFNKKNISRKECLLLPIRTVLKALKL